MGVFAKTGSRSLKTTLGGAAILGISALVLVGCSSGSTSSGGSDSGDLSLKIGTILPQTGTLAVLGPPEIAGVDLAAKDINDAKAGISIDVTQKDSGDTTTDIATQSATSLYCALSPVQLAVIDVQYALQSAPLWGTSCS
jgi:branched-chain amino acid transport system substrate-binding protein